MGQRTTPLKPREGLSGPPGNCLSAGRAAMISTTEPKIDKKAHRALVLLILVAAMVTCFFRVAYATPRTCTRQEAIQAETVTSSLKTWHDVFNSYKRYWHCDDGTISERYSDVVATLLAKHWDQFDDVLLLAEKHPKFRAFVLRHLDQTMTSAQDKAIRENVRSHCPPDGSHLCGLIGERFNELDREQKCGQK